MKPSEASKKLEFHSKQICHGCMHPSMVGWCENHCQLPEAFKMAISALKKQEQCRWHSVAKEGNPKKSGSYIVTDNSKMDGNKPHTRYFNAYGDKSFWSGWKTDEVVAWKEIISEPYEVGKEQ